MKHVSILIPRGHTSVVNIEGTHQILSYVNQFCQQLERPPVFKIQLVGIVPETKQTTGLFTINPDMLVKDIKKTDLIIIPAIHGDHQQAMENNREFVPWIIQQYKGGAEIVSFCVGAFFLAGTGLLKGRQCATHWSMMFTLTSARRYTLPSRAR
jgi:transcriptional regulator GlxA family with amidase domain